MRQQGKEMDTLTYYEMFYSDFFSVHKKEKNICTEKAEEESRRCVE